jgi:NAD(P)-dependent dehydrogenase (short-subunit alcohol dehydrogenase family)
VALNSDKVKRSILITGCSSGIGYRAAQILHQRGYRVFASARKPEDVTRLRSEGLEALQLDLADSDSIQAAVETLLDQTDGRLYALFNNGAFGQPGAVEDLSREVLREQFETNLFGWLELTNLILPIMRRQGEGRIIHNSSVLGLVALPFRGAYNSSKFALEGLSDTLRMELHGTGIHISLIQPGPIESRFRANAYALLKKNIDTENSPFREKYRGAEKRLQKEGHAAPFTLPPDAVVDKVIHALESKRPNARYYVTFPTYLFGTLRRLLSTRMMDRIMLKISGSENR